MPCKKVRFLILLQITTNVHWARITVMMMPLVPTHMDHFTVPVMLDLPAMVSIALVWPIEAFLSILLAETMIIEFSIRYSL